MFDPKYIAPKQVRPKCKLVCHMRCYPLWPLIYLILALAGAALALLVHWLFWLLLAAAVSLTGLHLYLVGSHYLYGPVKPGVVVSESPYLVAVLTDRQAKQSWRCPIIRVCPAPREHGSTPLQQGARQAMICPHLDTSSDAELEILGPVPLQLGLSEADAANRVHSAVSPQDWDALAEGIKQLPRPFQRGLYQVDLSHLEQYAQADHVELMSKYLSARLSPVLRVADEAWRRAVWFLLLIHLCNRMALPKWCFAVLAMLVCVVACLPLLVPVLQSWLWGSVAIGGGLLVVFFTGIVMAILQEKRWIRNVMVPMAQDRKVDLAVLALVLESIDRHDKRLSKEVRNWNEAADAYQAIVADIVPAIF